MLQQHEQKHGGTRGAAEKGLRPYVYMLFHNDYTFIHANLQGFNVSSFGTGDKIKLPGPAADRPNVYDFGTTYDEIHADLVNKDRTMYTQNGILHMLDRNRRIKKRPQRLQESKEQ